MFFKKTLMLFSRTPLKFQFSSLTLFEKIVNKTIPAKIIYEDSQALAFEDINPQAPIHFLVIPKKLDGLTQLSKADVGHKDILGHLLYICQLVAKQKKLENGFRIVINNGIDGGQTVFHLHLHVMGGKKMDWPPL